MTRTVMLVLSLMLAPHATGAGVPTAQAQIVAAEGHGAVVEAGGRPVTLTLKGKAADRIEGVAVLLGKEKVRDVTARLGTATTRDSRPVTLTAAASAKPGKYALHVVERGRPLEPAATTFQVVAPRPREAPAAALKSVTVEPATLAGGEKAKGTVVLTLPAPSAGAKVALSRSPGGATVGPNVTVAAGDTQATFEVRADAMSAPIMVWITASYGGVTLSAPLTVMPGSGGAGAGGGPATPGAPPR